MSKYIERFFVGCRVYTAANGVGYVKQIDNDESDFRYYVEFADGTRKWLAGKMLFMENNKSTLHVSYDKENRMLKGNTSDGVVLYAESAEELYSQFKNIVS